MKKRKIDFQDGSHGSHLGFLIIRILAIFNLQVTLILPTMFQVNCPFGSGEEAKNRFSRWRPQQPSWISVQNDFSYFLSTSHPNASYQISKFRVSWHFDSGEEAKNRFSRLDFQSERFYLFLIYKSHRWFLPSFESIGSGM